VEATTLTHIADEVGIDALRAVTNYPLLTFSLGALARTLEPFVAASTTLAKPSTIPSESGSAVVNQTHLERKRKRSVLEQDLEISSLHDNISRLPTRAHRLRRRI